MLCSVINQINTILIKFSILGGFIGGLIFGYVSIIGFYVVRAILGGDKD